MFAVEESTAVTNKELSSAMAASQSVGERKVSRFQMVFRAIVRSRDFSEKLLRTFSSMEREEKWRFAVQYQAATLPLMVGNLKDDDASGSDTAKRVSSKSLKASEQQAEVFARQLRVRSLPPGAASALLEVSLDETK